MICRLPDLPRAYLCNPFATFTVPGECVWRVSALLSTSLMVNDSLALTRELFIRRGGSELHMAQHRALWVFFFLTASSPLRKGSQTVQLPALWAAWSDVQSSLSRGFVIIFFIPPPFIPLSISVFTWCFLMSGQFRAFHSKRGISLWRSCYGQTSSISHGTASTLTVW